MTILTKMTCGKPGRIPPPRTAIRPASSLPAAEVSTFEATSGFPVARALNAGAHATSTDSSSRTSHRQRGVQRPDFRSRDGLMVSLKPVPSLHFYNLHDAVPTSALR